MNSVLKEVFELYKPLSNSINFQLINKILPDNSISFSDKDSIEKSYVIIKDYLNLKFSKNKNYTFIALDNVDCLMCRCSNNTYTLSFKLKDSPVPELYLDNIFLTKTINENKNEISSTLSLSSESYFYIGMSSDIDSFDIFFEDKDSISNTQEIERKIVTCPDLIPYFDKYKKLLKLFKLEPEAVSELLVKDKKFSSEQKDLFKLLYDFEIFDTEDLTTNLMSNIINKLEIKDKEIKNN